jgi:16S rRNA (cytosine967-C5)-methyltransferase
MPGRAASLQGARETALRALVRVEVDGAYLNLALPVLLEKLSGDERSLAVQLAAGTIQRLNTLDWIVNLFSRRSSDTFTPWIRNLIRLSAYQIIYLDRIPDYAVVDEAVRLARRFGHRGVARLVNALLRRISDQAAALPWPDRDKYPLEYLSLKHSQPQWLVARMVDRFGFAEAEKWCLANNLKPPLTIRPNLLQIKPEALIDKLHKEGIEAAESLLVPGMLRISPGSSPALTPSFREGLFTVQGESSALIAPLLSAQPGQTVVDLCSAPGGKTTHIAELMNDSGLVYAVEINQNRLQMVEKAARRLRLRSISPILADGRNIDRQNLPEPAAVLVDAPCSGLGVIRRLPEIKWRRREEDLLEMHILQMELLSAAAGLLPVGGKLLYSVCSNQPEETIQVAEAFSRAHPLFIPEPLGPLMPVSLQEGRDETDPVYFWPHRHGLDGFFIARWRKKGK